MERKNKMVMSLFEVNDYKVTNTITVGRFTIVEVTATDGIKGVGISRRSQGEKKREEVGKCIAINRAVKSIQKKRYGKTIHNVLMG